MSSKCNTASKTVVEKSIISENCDQIAVTDNKQLTSKDISDGVLVYDNCSTLIEVTVKAKGRKRTSTMVSSNSSAQKGSQEKKRANSIADCHHNWGHILREQNRPTMKQGLQQYATRSLSSKSTKHTIESKETRKSTDAHRTQKYEYNRANKHSDEFAIKAQKKSEDHFKSSQKMTAPPTSLGNNADVTLVIDKGVQCGGIFDTMNQKFDVFNPVRTLGFLMKELEHLVKDEKSNEILTHMEQVLFRIPPDSGKPTAIDLEAIALRNKLDISTAELEAMSRKMNAAYESLREEKNSLQKQVNEKSAHLEEAGQKIMELEMVVNKLRKDSDELNKSLDITKRTISHLNEETKRLKADLTEQTELARQRNLEMQFLKLEKEKILVLSEYKDSQLCELHKTLRELPNYISDELFKLKESYKYEEDEEISVVQGGLACSSPTSSRSEHFTPPGKPWQDTGNVSLSAVECDSSGILPNKHDSPPKDKTSPPRETVYKSVEHNKSSINNGNDNEADHLEFVSLQAGESTATFMKNKDKTFKESSQLDAKQVNEMLSSMKKNGILYQPTYVTGKSQSLDNFSDLHRKATDDRTNARNTPKPKRFFELKRKENIPKRNAVSEDISKLLKTSSTCDPVISNIKEQFQNILEDMRLQSKVPVSLPSPPRCFPHPEWSDSSLASISGTSELNVVQSNDS